MCGPTDAQTQLQQSQIDFYNNLQKQDATTFGQDQNILNQLQSVYSPILQKGPNQYGYTPDEENVLNTTATEGVAQNYRDASRSLRESQAAQGGGNDYLPVGSNQQTQAELASSAADQLSKEKLGIKTAGYQQGYNEFTQAAGNLLSTSQQLNPSTYASTANTAGSTASQTAQNIANENESWMAPLIGGVSTIASGAAGSYLKGK